MKYVIALFLFTLALALAVRPAQVYRHKLAHCDSSTALGGRFIVTYHDHVSLEQTDTHIESVGAEVEHRYKNVLNGFSSTLSDDQVSLLLAHPMVKMIECDQEVHALATCTDPSNCGSWGQARVSNQASWDGADRATTYTGASHDVYGYVIDTGIYVSNNDFGNRAEFGFKASSSWSDTDANGHGTHVASTMGGAEYGVCPYATKLYAVKVLGDNGSGTNAGVIAGVDWVASNNPKACPSSSGKKCVANMSLGGGVSSTLDAAVNSLQNSGVLTVVAAGNDNSDACGTSPSRASDVVTVGSTAWVNVGGSTNRDERSSFSNYGQCVDVFAPGSAIVAAYVGSTSATATLSGTSMASPHVAGVGMLYMSDGDTATQARAKLISQATNDVISMNCFSSSCLDSPNKLVWNGCGVGK